MKLTALFRPLENFIKEHGSASILRDHVSLMKSEISIRDEKVKELEKSQTKSNIENENLRKIIKDCQDENKRLNKTISDLKKKSFHKSPRRVISKGWVRDW